VEQHFSETGEFAYRANEDGTVDSICLMCYRTAGSALCGISLKDLERKHSCPRAPYVSGWKPAQKKEPGDSDRP
jgi:hypothetical protein